EHAGAPCGCADIKHKTDAPPTHTKTERRGENRGAQPAGGHPIFDTTALRNIEGTVMKCNGQVIVVGPPQLLKKKLRLAACIDEYQRGLVRLYLRVDFSKSMTRRMAGSWQMLLGIEHRDDRLGASFRRNQ